jgi:uncharacterized membrane protein HdeD (DUF308 family)
MLKTFFSNWWLLVLRGALLIIFGILAFMNPGTTFAVLLSWFAAFLFIDGVFSLVTVFRNWKQQEDKWLFVLDGALNIILGVLIFTNPGVYTLIAMLMIAFWSIFSGVSRIALAIQLRKEIEGEGWLALSGVLSILFGVIVIAQPGIGVATFIYMIAIFALLIGILLVLLGFKVKKAGVVVKEKVQEVRSALQ